MKVLIAPDKFKGTLSARAAAESIARGWRMARPDDTLELQPISDGGDGFGELTSAALGARPQSIGTVDAAHRPCTATWWWDAKTKTALIESANVVGLAMLPRGRFHPFDLDTFGLAKILRAATRRGAAKIIIGIGGSATNDGGFGLARALGWIFLDDDGNPILKWTDLRRLVSIHAPLQLHLADIVVAVDVRNPLLGKHGATRIYGPQKGLHLEDLSNAEANLKRLAAVAKSGRSFASQPGGGAAGGLGFGLAAFCNAKLHPGFELFVRQTNFRRHIRKADLVITGEGSIDRSTVMGKGVGELARLCKEENVPCIGLGGITRLPRNRKNLFTSVHALTDLTTAHSAMLKPELWLGRLTETVAKCW